MTSDKGPRKRAAATSAKQPKGKKPRTQGAQNESTQSEHRPDDDNADDEEQPAADKEPPYPDIISSMKFHATDDLSQIPELYNPPWTPSAEHERAAITAKWKNLPASAVNAGLRHPNADLQPVNIFVDVHTPWHEPNWQFKKHEMRTGTDKEKKLHDKMILGQTLLYEFGASQGLGGHPTAAAMLDFSSTYAYITWLDTQGL